MPLTTFNRFPEIIATLGPKVAEALEQGAEAVVEDAKQRVPVESGDLQDAIHAEKQDEGVYVIAGDSNVFYGHMVELGTSHSPAEPFLIPALEAQKDGILKRVSEALD